MFCDNTWDFSFSTIDKLTNRSLGDGFLCLDFILGLWVSQKSGHGWLTESHNTVLKMQPKFLSRHLCYFRSSVLSGILSCFLTVTDYVGSWLWVIVFYSLKSIVTCILLFNLFHCPERGVEVSSVLNSPQGYLNVNKIMKSLLSNKH